MAELIEHLRAMRVEMVETMARELGVDGNWAAWLALLAQTEMALQAVEAVMEERAGPPRMRDNENSLASETGSKLPSE